MTLLATAVMQSTSPAHQLAPLLTNMLTMTPLYGDAASEGGALQGGLQGALEGPLLETLAMGHMMELEGRIVDTSKV